jgi:hypothetical protein
MTLWMLSFFQIFTYVSQGFSDFWDPKLAVSAWERQVVDKTLRLSLEHLRVSSACTASVEHASKNLFRLTYRKFFSSDAVTGDVQVRRTCLSDRVVKRNVSYCRLYICLSICHFGDLWSNGNG